MREKQQEGEYFTMPNQSADVEIKIIGTWMDGGKEREFYNKSELKYFIGEGSTSSMALGFYSM